MMHYHGTFSKVVGFLVCLLLSVTGIIIGLMAFNVDVMNMHFVQNLHGFMKPLQIAVGVAGVLGLLYLLGLGMDKCGDHKDSHHSR